MEPLKITLDRVIHDLERQQDHPGQLTFVRRRLGNVVMHLKQLRDDTKPAEVHDDKQWRAP